MLLFRSEEEIDAWCRTQGEPRGETLTFAQVWNLSKAWYGNRMNPDYRGRTPTEAERLFEQLGLDSPFWKAGT